MNITPKPTKITLADGSYVVGKGAGIGGDCTKAVKSLNEFTTALLGYGFGEGRDVILRLADGDFGEEGYLLSVGGDGVLITAATEQGLFYGVQTLKQLIAEYYDGEKSEIPAVEIFDKPVYAYRSFMLDCCRHFFDVAEVKKMINVCALLKLNRFHWGLSNDQGWRVQIDKYPKLIEVGSKRASTRDDGVPVEGYFTKTDVAEVLAYAADRFIEVIPEINMPGHSMAAIASYPHLSCEGKEIAVETRFGIKSTIFCAGKESTYEFLKDVLAEIAEMFPSPYVHIGGDEAVKPKWRACPDCQKTIEENGLKDEEELQAFFTKKIVDYLKTLGKTAIVWNEACKSGKLDADCILQYWREGGGAKQTKEELLKGRKVIISQFTPYYLDYPHGMHPLRAVYKFNPRIAEGDIWGVEGPLWTEYIATNTQVEKQTFPRLFAIAERGWSDPAKKEYVAFKSRVKYMDAILDGLGVEYTSTAEADVPRIRGTVDMLRFFANTVDKQLLAETKANRVKKKKRTK